MSPNDALYLAARSYPGGIEALAVRLGVSVHVLYKQLRPEVDTHLVSFDRALMILEMLEGAGRKDMAEAVIDSVLWRFDRVAVELPDVEASAGSLLRQLTRVTGRVGDLASDLDEALADDRLSARERDQLDADCHACVQALVAFRHKIKPGRVDVEA